MHVLFFDVRQCEQVPVRIRLISRGVDILSWIQHQKYLSDYSSPFFFVVLLIYFYILELLLDLPKEVICSTWARNAGEYLFTFCIDCSTSLLVFCDLLSPDFFPYYLICVENRNFDNTNQANYFLSFSCNRFKPDLTFFSLLIALVASFFR